MDQGLLGPLYNSLAVEQAVLPCCVLCESSVDASHTPSGMDTGADGA